MKLLALGAAWIGGLLIGLLTQVPLLPVLLLLLAVVVLGILLRVRGQPLWPIVLLPVLLLGLIRAELVD